MNFTEKICSSNIGSIKGKTMCWKLLLTFNNIIKIPSELWRIYEEFKISTDGLSINNMRFMSSILHNLFY